MAKRPKPSTVASIQARLRNYASAAYPGVPGPRRANMTYQVYYAQGFLSRLALSPVREKFILGGSWSLYRARGTSGRHTKDIDFDLIREQTPDEVETDLQTILSQPLPEEDFLQFGPIELVPIMPDTLAGGLRAFIRVTLGGVTADQVTIDIAMGLVVEPIELLIPQLLRQAPIPIMAAPIEAVLAGKVSAMLARGSANTRYKDYFDVWHAATTQDFPSHVLEAALRSICQQQGVKMDPTAEVFASPSFPFSPAQLEGWKRFVDTGLLGASAPPFEQALRWVRALYGPVLAGQVPGKLWRHKVGQWI